VTGRLFVLAIDHRASLRKWSAGVLGAEASAAQLSELKLIVADALVEATEHATGEPAGHADGLQRVEVAMLCEPGYGSAAMARVARAGIQVIVPVEQSGRQEFIFEHGDDGFAAAISESGADAVKALVRYNPSQANKERNAASRRRLAMLGRYCERNGVCYMLELLVPPGPDDVDERGEPSPGFDSSVRPGLTLRAIAELRELGLCPKWWKLEGQPGLTAFKAVADATGASSGTTACLVLGRAAPITQVLDWVRQAAATEGFAGFAVGRSLWSPPLSDALRGSCSRDEAVAWIAEQYVSLVDAYEAHEHDAVADSD